MNPEGPQLLDIHLPPPPSWWPPAVGWWLLAGLLLVLLGGVTVWLRRRAQRRGTLRLFEHELDLVVAKSPAPALAAARVAGLSVLLRRIAGHHAPHALRLIDEAWLEFLDGSDPSRPFSSGPGRLLLDAPYRPHVSAEDADRLTELVRRSLPRWLERRDV